MRFQFRRKENPPARHLADMEVIFEDGALEGLKLTGFALWLGKEDGEVYVTLPSRKISEDGKEARYYDLLRSVTASSDTIKAFKARVVEAYQRQAIEATG